MPIPVQQFQILSPQQANPLGTGLSSGQDLYRHFIINHYLPQQLQEQAKQSELANELAKIKLQYSPEVAQVDLAKEREETQKMLMARLNPLLNATGPAGQIGAALWLNSQKGLSGLSNNLSTLSSEPDNNAIDQSNGLSTKPGSLADAILHNLKTAEESKQSFGKYYDKKTQGYAYQQMPIDFKNQAIAQAQGFGYDPTEASELFSQGKSIQDLAKNKGYDPNSPAFFPQPLYAPTSSTRSINQKREQATAELNTLGKKLSDWSAPYSRRVEGYSPKQIVEALSGENEEAQAKFIASRILAPEYAAIRLRALSGVAGITAIKEISHKSMTDLNLFQPLVSPSVYKKANQYANEAIEEAVAAAQKAGNLPGRSFNQTSNTKTINGITYRRIGNSNDWEY